MHLLDYKKVQRLIEAITVAKTVKRLRKPEKALTARLARIFQLQRRQALKALSKYREEFNEALTEDRLTKLFTSAFSSTADLMASAIQTTFETVILLGASDAITEYALGIDFELDNPLAAALIKNYGVEEVKGITETTAEILANLVLRGLVDGLSYNTVEKQIRETFNGFSKNRSQMIAVNQAARAYGFGNYAAMKAAEDTGLTFEKKWLTTGDDKVTPECEANSNEDWIPVDQEHKSGDMYPPRSNNPRCRCVEQYRRVGAA